MKDRENMNKILPYIMIAILLGTVTMVVPYALLGPSDYTSPTEESTLIQPSTTEPPAPEPTEPEKLDNQERAYTEGGDLENGDTLAPVPEGSIEPQEAEPSGLAATEADLILESLSALSPIGLMTIPSFLIALGAFIYLKKRMS